MDELKNIKSDSSFIPEGCLNFVEESTYVVAAIDEEFEDLMESCGLNETNMPAGESEPDADAGKEADKNVPTSESAEVVTEGEAGRKFREAKESVVKFIQGIWAKIKKVCEDMVKGLKDQVAEAKKKFADAFSAKWDSVEFKSDAKIGKYHVAKNIGDTKWMEPLKSKAQQASDDNKGFNYAAVNAAPYRVLAAVDSSASASDTDIEAMKDGLRKYFLGEETAVTGANIKSCKDDVLGIIKGSQMKDVKATYNKAREVINNLIAEAKKSAKATSDASEKEKTVGTINVIRRYSQILATGIGVQFDCIRQQNREALAIAAKVAFKINKKKEEPKEEAKPKTEAAIDIFAW